MILNPDEMSQFQPAKRKLGKDRCICDLAMDASMLKESIDHLFENKNKNWYSLCHHRDRDIRKAQEGQCGPREKNARQRGEIET